MLNCPTHKIGHYFIFIVTFDEKYTLESCENKGAMRTPLLWDMTLRHWVVGYRRFEGR